jgi:hypothetical protein
MQQGKKKKDATVLELFLLKLCLTQCIADSRTPCTEAQALEPPCASSKTRKFLDFPSRSSDPPTAHYSALCQHLRGEAIVFKRVRWYLVPSIFFGVHMFLIVFRRTSFFMEKFGLESGTLSSGPLYDLGSAFFTSAFGLPDMTVPDPDPEIQKRNIDRILGLIGITDSFMAAISAMLFIVPIASWYQAWTDGRLPKDPVYAANFFNRYVFVLILGHFMRFLSYTATVVPGPSYHCRPDFKQPGTGIAYMDLLPKNAYSIFFPSVEQ